jgi:hypothetical protein
MVIRTDYQEGDPPVPIGTVVEYFGSLRPGHYWVDAHSEPINVPGLANWPAVSPMFFPDGTAYVLWPVGVPRTFRYQDRRVVNARRTSLRVVGEPDLLVAAAGSTTTAHASPLLVNEYRLKLTPWNTLCGQALPATTRVETSVTCKTCLRVMEQRGFALGDLVGWDIVENRWVKTIKEDEKP